MDQDIREFRHLQNSQLNKNHLFLVFYFTIKTIPISRWFSHENLVMSIPAISLPSPPRGELWRPLVAARCSRRSPRRRRVLTAETAPRRPAGAAKGVKHPLALPGIEWSEQHWTTIPKQCLFSKGSFEGWDTWNEQTSSNINHVW